MFTKHIWRGIILFLLTSLYCESNHSGTKVNRLAKEKSPYLLQHATNPVDWYPWSDEAFEKARREDKPIFLSIGYSTCHWCHVMEQESFEDSTVAALNLIRIGRITGNPKFEKMADMVGKTLRFFSEIGDSFYTKYTNIKSEKNSETSEEK